MEQQVLGLSEQVRVRDLSGIGIAAVERLSQPDGLRRPNVASEAGIVAAGNCLLAALSPRKHKHRRQGHRGRRQKEGGFLCLRLFHQLGNPPLDGFLSSGHGGGAGQHPARPGPPGHQPDQRAAVGDALRLPQPGNGPLVAGQLPVPFGQDDCRPHQGVIPVEGQGQAPEKGPDVVPVPEVGELVGEHMGADCSVLRRLRGEVDGGAEHPAQTGGGQLLRLIHRQGTARCGEGAAASAELLSKPQIGGQHRQQDHAGPPPTPSPRRHGARRPAWGRRNT